MASYELDVLLLLGRLRDHRHRHGGYKIDDADCTLKNNNFDTNVLYTQYNFNEEYNFSREALPREQMSPPIESLSLGPPISRRRSEGEGGGMIEPIPSPLPISKFLLAPPSPFAGNYYVERKKKMER